MWQLSVRGENRPWTELGMFEGIGPATRRIMPWNWKSGNPPPVTSSA
jgi:hypothetical protein